MKTGGVTSPSLIRKIIIAVLSIAALVTIAHWIPRIFPAWPYHVAHKYLVGAKAAIAKHDENLKKFRFVGGTPEKLPGAVFEEKLTVADANLITSQGPATGYPFAFRLAEAFGYDTGEVRSRLMYGYAGGKDE